MREMFLAKRQKIHQSLSKQIPHNFFYSLHNRSSADYFHAGLDLQRLQAGSVSSAYDCMVKQHTLKNFIMHAFLKL